MGRFLILAGFIFMFILTPGYLIAAESDMPDTPDSASALLKAELEMMEMQKAQAIPIPESANNGYWWIEQTDAVKLEYVKNLKKLLKEKEIIVKLKPKTIIEKLDEIYNPMDNPLDIKMDKSIERMFCKIIKGDD